MRVAMLIQAFHPRVGGAERQLLAVSPLLAERGVDVHVVTRRYPGTGPFDVVAGVPVHRLGAPGARSGSLAYTAAAQPLLRRLRPDVLAAFELLSPTTTAALAQLHLRAPLVVKVLGGGELEMVRSRPLGDLRLRLLLDRVDRFHVVSDDIDRGLAALGVAAPRRVRVPNGVDTARYRPPTPQERTAARSALGLTGPAVLVVGRLSPEKGIADLQAAWPDVRRAHPGAVLLVAGDGPCGGQLRRAAPEGCVHLGSVPDVLPLLHAADVLALPSHQEGSPNAVLEAMAAGLPCVVTAVGGSVELADGGRAALTVPPGRPDLLATALVAALRDPASARARAAHALATVVRARGLPATADRLAGLYGELAAAGPGSWAGRGASRRIAMQRRRSARSGDATGGGRHTCATSGSVARDGGEVSWQHA